jgi:two-component system sensor histidine kinase/response regulator
MMDDYKILLIEDNPLLQNIFCAFLETLNCTNVDTARTGRQALSLYEKHKYALILLDIGLPDINGIEVCKRIRKKEDHTPVVAITAYDTARQECRQAGFNDFALKPVLLEKMDYLVKRWILSAL